jgi:hypothetical protein
MFPFQRVPSFVPRDPTPEPVETRIARQLGQQSPAAMAARVARQGRGQAPPPPAPRPAVPVRVESAEERRARHAEYLRQAAAANPVLAAQLARLRAARGR